MTGLEIITAIASIIVIDLILGGDNAILIALASKALAPAQRKKAIFWGVVGAVLIRTAFTAAALYLLKIPLLQFAGGLLLVWIAFKLLVEEKKVECQTGNSLIEAIKIIIVADVVMGIDNVIAIAGASHGSLVMVIFGLLISVPIIVWGSTIILKLIEKYPAIVYAGAAVLAWTAGKMIVNDSLFMKYVGSSIPNLTIFIPVLIIVGVLCIGYYKNLKTVR